MLIIQSARAGPAGFGPVELSRALMLTMAASGFIITF